MNKMIARTALVATLALSALSLSACGTNNDCAHAAGSTVTATTAMFPARAGGGHGSGGHASEGGAHGETSTGAHEGETSTGSAGGFVWPHWFGGGHSDQCQNPAPATKS